MNAPLSGALEDLMDFNTVIRTIPDYPKKGIQFRDITTLLGNPRAFRSAVDALVQPYAGVRIDKVAGIEARGFIMGGAVAHQLSTGFVPVRKKGKLPYKVLGEDYDLEYGKDRVEIHVDAVKPGEHVIVVDDLIATGGTCFATIKLLERAGAKVVGCCFTIDLPDLGGADKIRALGMEVTTLVAFSGH
jgi:adenine phosphoribosyltransferase